MSAMRRRTGSRRHGNGHHAATPTTSSASAAALSSTPSSSLAPRCRHEQASATASSQGEHSCTPRPLPSPSLGTPAEDPCPTLEREISWSTRRANSPSSEYRRDGSPVAARSSALRIAARSCAILLRRAQLSCRAGRAGVATQTNGYQERQPSENLCLIRVSPQGSLISGENRQDLASSRAPLCADSRRGP